MEGTLDQNDDDYSENYEDDIFDEENMINKMNLNQQN